MIKTAGAPFAIDFFGHSNSGKTTLIEKLIAVLCQRGISVGAIKHHGHRGFDIDVPGKDSWRFAQAGSVHTCIISPDRYAEIKDLDREVSPQEVLQRMDDVDVVIVEGFRGCGLPCIELFRSGNKRDAEVPALLDTEGLVAVVTDIDAVAKLAAARNMPCFSLDDVEGIADFIEKEASHGIL